MLRHLIRTHCYLLQNRRFIIHHKPGLPLVSCVGILHFSVSPPPSPPPTAMEDPKGTVIFSTVGRPNYGFDVFSLNLTSNTGNPAPERRLTDGISINFNAQFVEKDDHSVVFVSERSGSPRIYMAQPGQSQPDRLPFIPQSLFHDRPILKNDRLYFISAHEQPDRPFKSWPALYSSNRSGSQITRLTPSGVVDYSPAISESGKFIAVASYGSHPWDGEFHQLNTDIVIFSETDSNTRLLVCEKGGWPTWSGDSTIYFHRQADDGWWSIFSIDLPGKPEEFSGFPIAPLRVTPPGVHCFTPAAFYDNKRLAVSTRRRGKDFRHIEIFEIESKVFQPVTELLNPSFHHYNPFVSPDGRFLGYHRFRGESTQGESTIPQFEQVMSPVKDLRMLRINGNFPAFSPSGDFVVFNPDFDLNSGVKVVRSDGTKRWTLIKGRIAFYNAWSPAGESVIFTSLGPIFESAKATVQIARITFDSLDLNDDGEDVRCEIKILTRDDTGNNAFPSVSPDGKYLVFRSGRSGHKNLYIVDAVDGEFHGGIRPLTDGPWIDTMPSWSPKGDLIAFSSNRHNPDDPAKFSIYTVKPDGSDVRRIYVAGAEGSEEVERERINHLCFSEDGEWILFAANLGGVTAEPVSLPNQFQPYGDLFVVRADGSGLRRLTWNAYENGTPAWHPRAELDLASLGLEKRGFDKLGGHFQEPLWITCDF